MAMEEGRVDFVKNERRAICGDCVLGDGVREIVLR
jgi:hypothetical protein